MAASLARFTSGMFERAFLQKGGRAACATSPSTQPPRRGGHLLLLVAAAALIVSACGSPASKSPKKTPTPTPIRTAASSSTPDASDAAVLAAYQSYIAAVNQAAAASSGTGAWNVPALAATTVNPELQYWTNELMQLEAQDIMVQGTLTPEHPRVISNTGATAVVSDCVWDAAIQYYKPVDGASPDAVPDQPNGANVAGDGWRVTLTVVGAKWMVSDGTTEYGTCAGY
jgi:hypothetical protein